MGGKGGLALGSCSVRLFFMRKIQCKVCLEFYDSKIIRKELCSKECETIFLSRLSERKNIIQSVERKQDQELAKRLKIKSELKLERLKYRIRKKEKEKNGKVRSIQQRLSGFYNSPEWLSLRFKALKSMKRKCALCHTEHGEMHVDHIKPRSKYPELELDLNNLQILCRSCNIGKSNDDETDWRNT